MFCEVKLKQVFHGMVDEGAHPKAQKQATRSFAVTESALPKWDQQFTFIAPVQDALRISVFARALKKTKVGQIDLRFAEILPLLTPGKPLTNSYPLHRSKDQDGGRARDRDQTGMSLSVSLMLPSNTTVPIPDVDVEFVEFAAVRDPPAVLRFTAAGDALQYVIDGGDARPPFRKIEFNGSLRLRFPEIQTAAVVPQAECIDVFAGLRCLAKKAGIAHNIPAELDPADAALRTELRRTTTAEAKVKSKADVSSPTSPKDDDDADSEDTALNLTRGLDETLGPRCDTDLGPRTESKGAEDLGPRTESKLAEDLGPRTESKGAEDLGPRTESKGAESLVPQNSDSTELPAQESG